MALPFPLRTVVENVEEWNGGWLKIGVDYGYSQVNRGTGEICSKREEQPERGKAAA